MSSTTPASAAALPVTGERTYLCRAWGETDLPCADIVSGLDAVRAFFISEWTGQDDPETLTPIMGELAERDWRGYGNGQWSAEFEIGGISVELVAAALAPTTPVPAEPVMLSLFPDGPKTWPHYFGLKVGQRVKTHTGMDGTIAAILPQTKCYHVLRDPAYGGTFGPWEVTPVEATPAQQTPVPAEPVAWNVRNAEISYWGIFATEKEARAIADQHDEAGYSQAIVMPLVYPSPAQQTQSDAVAGAVDANVSARLAHAEQHLHVAVQSLVDGAKNRPDLMCGWWDTACTHAEIALKDVEVLKRRMSVAATPPQQATPSAAASVNLGDYEQSK